MNATDNSFSESAIIKPLSRAIDLKWRAVAVLVLLYLGVYAQSGHLNLHNGWQFRQEGTSRWYPATVPGTIHTDLMANGLIEDPFADNNEKKLQWIEKKNWEYRTFFDFPVGPNLNGEHELIFEGLDTYADVYLNGKKVLEANNMFRTWRVTAGHLLKKKGNELRIVFTSPITKNHALARQHPPLPGGSDTSQYPVWPYTRKAAYHFGWDWAPRMVTCGIYRPVFIRSWQNLVLRNVRFDHVEISDTQARIEALLLLETREEARLGIKINDQVFQAVFKPGVSQQSFVFTIHNPRLWWPNGSGEPHLYSIRTAVYRDNDTLAVDVQRLGLRTIELVNRPDSIGTSFYFKVNNKPVFIKGANYVPQDVFLPRVQDSQYVHLLSLVRDAGMNMVRVWGGGVYEREIFYDLCDEYGIMVWQDFMFAGTMYPGDSAFLQNIREEVVEQLARIGKHSCIALWCGNNEIEVAWKNWGWQKQYGYSSSDSLQMWNDYTAWFEQELRALTYVIDGPTPYVSTSPQSNWGTPSNFNHGSMHYWGVWHGPDDFSGYEKNVGRFMVEWGFQSYPDFDLLARYITPPFRELSSEVMQNRQKSYVGNGKITKFLELYEMEYKDFRSFVEQSQQLQAKGYDRAIRAHLTAQPHSMGTLLWQLNDCWPGPSWSIINYNGGAKAAYHAVRKAFSEK
jgi:beta-mannosidase